MADGSTSPQSGNQPGPPPPKPGDSVPQGGLDPTQVFAAPPAPPTPPPGTQGASTPATGQQPAGGTPPPAKDSGKTPPPAGTPVNAEELKKQGYDDEDIRVLGIVGNYRFGDISSALTVENIVAPAHPESKFDEKAFLLMLAGSISLMGVGPWVGKGSRKLPSAIPRAGSEEGKP